MERAEGAVVRSSRALTQSQEPPPIPASRTGRTCDGLWRVDRLHVPPGFFRTSGLLPPCLFTARAGGSMQSVWHRVRVIRRGRAGRSPRHRSHLDAMDDDPQKPRVSTIVLPCPHCRNPNTIEITDEAYQAAHRSIGATKIAVTCDHCRTEHSLREFERERDRQEIEQAKEEAARREQQAYNAKLEREYQERDKRNANVEQLIAAQLESEQRERELREYWRSKPETELLLRMHDLLERQSKQLEVTNKRLWPPYIVACITLIAMAISLVVFLVMLAAGARL